MSDDDDFWTTYIAATPDEDKDFGGCGPATILFCMAIALLLALVFFRL